VKRLDKESESLEEASKLLLLFIKVLKNFLSFVPSSLGAVTDMFSTG
jgi:hypothetical protein